MKGAVGSVLPGGADDRTKAPGRIGAAIRAATEKLRTVAREEKASAYEQFGEDLALHARSEEEVLYPAAILAGDIIRARQAQP